MVQKIIDIPEGKFVVGLTGVFGSGKSTVADYFKELGACVIDADKLAHEAFLPQSSIRAQMIEMFPEGLDRDGCLDRKKIAAIVFTDDVRRKKLEALVHPYVFRRMSEEIGKAPQGPILLDVPLLYETGLDEVCSVNVVVKASQDVIVKRLKEKGYEPEDVKVRISAQMPSSVKEKKADMVIDNNQSRDALQNEIQIIWKNIHRLSKGDK